MSYSPVELEANAAGTDLNDVETYISTMWNRTLLEAEASEATGIEMADVNFTSSVASERLKLERRGAEEGVHCPAKPDSCDAALREQEAAPGCPGVRGGVEDCSLWPQECALLRAVLRQLYLGTVSGCSFWNGTHWVKDGSLVDQTQTATTCAFDHLTAFSTFIGPAPKFNRMDVGGIFSKEWLQNNPVSAIIAFSSLIFSIWFTWLGVRVYKERLAEVDGGEHDRQNYDLRSSEFARMCQLIDNVDISWFRRVVIQLRIKWPLGAVLFGYSGDPYTRHERMLVIWTTAQIACVLNVIFFKKPGDPKRLLPCILLLSLLKFLVMIQLPRQTSDLYLKVGT